MLGSSVLANLSDQLMTVTIVAYSLAMLGFTAQFAYGRGFRASAATSAGPVARVHPPVAAGTLGGAADVPVLADPAGAAHVDTSTPGEPATPLLAWIGRFAMVLVAGGWATHLTEIVTRGMAAQRLPWGNMYEFTSALAFAAITVFLVMAARWHLRPLGLFVMIPVVLGLGLGTTVLYVPVGPLAPSLHSYWLAIHVSAAVVASGGFTVAATTNVLHLVSDRYERRAKTGHDVGLSALARNLPAKHVLDRLTYRIVSFGFPLWTFAVIAGAIWADQAWGRYWGWDPKETWAFITWVVYAAYLHARTTAGWRGRKAAVIALVGFGCLMFNLIGVNIWFSGLHSYADLG